MPETFFEVLTRLHREQFTGAMVVQFGQGVPSVVEFPQPATQIRLDKLPRPRPDLTHSLDSRT